MEQIKKTAEKVLKNCLDAKPGEVLLIVTDNTCGDIAGALYESGKDLGCEAVMMTMAELKVNGQEPPEIVAQAMKSADIVICPTAKSLTHTNARIEAVKNGARVATMPGITADMFLNGAMTADYNAVEALTKKVVALLSEASVAVIEFSRQARHIQLGNIPRAGSMRKPAFRRGIYRSPRGRNMRRHDNRRLHGRYRQAGFAAPGKNKGWQAAKHPGRRQREAGYTAQKREKRHRGRAWHRYQYCRPADRIDTRG